MAQPNRVLSVLVVTLSAGIVLGVYLLVKPGERPTPAAGASKSGMLASDGIRAADQDSALRLPEDGVADDDPEAPRLPTVAPVAEALAEPAPREGAPPPEPPPPPVELSAEQQAAQDDYFALQAKTAGQVAKALGQQKGALKQACWKPELTNGISSAAFALNASFDAQGKLLASSISDRRAADGSGAGGVGACLREQALKLDIPAPGQQVNVDVPLSLP